MVTSNRATVTVFATMWSWPLTFWPLGQCVPSDCYRVTQYTCTKFGVDSSSHFPVRARTNRQTDRQTNRQTRLNAHTHAGGYAGVGNDTTERRSNAVEWLSRLITLHCKALATATPRCKCIHTSSRSAIMISLCSISQLMRTPRMYNKALQYTQLPVHKLIIYINAGNV